MIPYVAPPAIELGPLRIEAMDLLIGLAIVVFLVSARRRVIQRDLSVRLTLEATAAVALASFFLAHVVAVVAYAPEALQGDWSLLLPWESGLSSFGGFLGAALAGPLMVRYRRAPVWAYADAWLPPFLLAWSLGRLGCFTAHDHLGRLTDFVFAVDFPGGARHDLGLYEAVLTLAMWGLLVGLERRRERFHGYLIGLACVLYAVVRFGLDFLRAEDLEQWGGLSDTRWAGLTPAQYGSALLLLFGVWILGYRRSKGRQDTRAESQRDRQATG